MKSDISAEIYVEELVNRREPIPSHLIDDNGLERQLEEFFPSYKRKGDFFVWDDEIQIK